WDLEIKRGEIETNLAFSQKALMDFSGVLAPTEYTAKAISIAVGGYPNDYMQDSLTSADGRIVFSSPGGNKVSAYNSYTYGKMYAWSLGSSPRPLEIAADGTLAETFELHELKICSVDPND